MSRENADEKILDPNDGSIRINDHFRITRLTTLDELVGCFGKNRVNLIDHKNGCQSASIRNIRIGEHWFCFHFNFADGLLCGMVFVLGDREFVGGWENWSEVEEMRRLKFCENWLYSQTDTMETLFHWGRIKAVYDSKGGGAYIGLQYE